MEKDSYWYIDWFEEFINSKVKKASWKMIWEILVENNLISNDDLKDILEYQTKMKNIWVNLSVLDIVVWKWYQKTRTTILPLLQDNSIDLRLWEILFKSWLISEKQLNSAIVAQNKYRLKWRNISFWEILIELWILSEKELLKFLHDAWIRMTNSELIIHYWILTKFHLDCLTNSWKKDVNISFLMDLVDWWLLSRDELKIFEKNIKDEDSRANLYWDR